MQYREIWAYPKVHPFDGRACVPWNDSYLAHYKHLLMGLAQISQVDAEKLGFTFGRLQGPFAHARAKLEEAQLLLEALQAAAPLPNFPVYSALFFGFLGATYAVKEALCKSCKRLGSDAYAWYEVQFQQLKQDPVVSAFYELNNQNKHEPKNLPLHSALQMRDTRVFGGPPGAKVVMSNEGIFGVVDEGSVKERVEALSGVADATWLVTLDMPERGVNGPATPLAEHVLRFYERFLFDARRTHGNEANLSM